MGTSGGSRSRGRSACGHAEPRTSKSEARHRRKLALGVEPSASEERSSPTLDSRTSSTDTSPPSPS
jgi:hypothetical protein